MTEGSNKSKGVDLHDGLICTRPLFMMVEEEEGDSSARTAHVGGK